MAVSFPHISGSELCNINVERWSYEGAAALREPNLPVEFACAIRRYPV